MECGQIESRCRNIRLLITDVDGVMTDGGMYYSEFGDELKKFNVRDGAGVALLHAAGIQVAAMTGEMNSLNETRMKKLKMDFFWQDVKNKKAVLDAFLTEREWSADSIAYIGDEINDICLLGQVGLFFAVADACDVLRERADVVLKTPGGRGALREAAEVILKSRNEYSDRIESYRRKMQAANTKVQVISFSEKGGEFIPLHQ